MNKLLLLSFSCLILILSIAMLTPIYSSIFDSGMIAGNGEYMEEIEEEIENLYVRGENFINSELNSSKIFSFMVDMNITGYIFAQEKDYAILRFYFYYNEFSSPIIRTIRMNFSLQVSFERFFLNTYHFFFLNDSMYLNFNWFCKIDPYVKK